MNNFAIDIVHEKLNLIFLLSNYETFPMYTLK